MNEVDLIEALAMVHGTRPFEAGAAFFGSQGDVWDAQKDILCDTLGALCAATLFLLREKR